EGGSEQRGADCGTDFVRPFGGDFKDGETGVLEGVEEVDIEGQVRNAQARVHFFNRAAAHYFAGTLSVLDVKPEQGLDDQMEAAAGELAEPGLGLVQYSASQPARPNDAVRLVQQFDQVEKGVRGRGAVGIDVTHDVG